MAVMEKKLMAEVLSLPADFDSRVRLLAAELQDRRGTIQLREIATHAGRLAEQARCAGAQRWQAVRIEDTFKAAVRARLDELAGMPRERPARVLPLKSQGAA